MDLAEERLAVLFLPFTPSPPLPVVAPPPPLVETIADEEDDNAALEDVEIVAVGWKLGFIIFNIFFYS